MAEIDNTRFIEVGLEKEIPVNERLFVEIDGKPIVIINLAGKLFAVGDVCTHDNGPAGDGELSSPFRVKVSDLDVNHHTNNARYLNWATDTYSLGFLMKNESYSAEINYLAESVYDDEIAIQKSVWNNNNSIYDHSIFKKSDNRELCRIRLTWKEIKNPKVN